MKKVLTLGNGLVGGAIRKSFLSDPNYEVATTNRDGAIDYSMNISKADEVERVIREFQPDVVINGAQVAGYWACKDNPERANRVNVEGARVLTRVLESIAPNTFLIQLSSVAVFSGRQDRDYIETDQPDPSHLYGETLYKAEQIITKSSVKSVITRAPHVLGEDPKNERKSIIELIEQCLNGEVDFNAYSDNRLSPITSTDFGAGIKFLVENNIHANEIVHIAGDYLGSTETLAELVARKLNHPQRERLNIIPTPATGMRNSVLDNQKIKDLGFQFSGLGLK